MQIKVGLGCATSQSDAACQAYVVDRGTKTRLTLEMRSPAQLVRAAPDERIRFREVEDNDELLVRIFHEVGDPHLWSAQSWASCGSPPAKRHWLIDVDDEPAGLLTLHFEPDGEVEIVSFGLVPGKQGCGLGGWSLTTAVDLAWTTFGDQVSRVWLHTNNFDHPNALPNYLKTRLCGRREGRLPLNVPGGWMPPSSRLPLLLLNSSLCTPEGDIAVAVLSHGNDEQSISQLGITLAERTTTARIL